MHPATSTPGGLIERPKRFFTVAEAAGLLGVSEPTLYRAIRAGEFPAVRVRGRYVVPAKAIDQIETLALSAVLADRADHTAREVK